MGKQYVILVAIRPIGTKRYLKWRLYRKTPYTSKTEAEKVVKTYGLHALRHGLKAKVIPNQKAEIEKMLKSKSN